MSLLFDILDGCETAISAISVLSGYQNDWGSVNEEDQALVEYPSAVLDITQEDAVVPTIHSGAYLNDATLRVLVRAELTDSNQYPRRAIYESLYSAIEDIKQCFGRNPSIGGAFSIEYLGFEIVGTHDHFHSASAEMRFRVRYSQDRQDTTTNAC